MRSVIAKFIFITSGYRPANYRPISNLSTVSKILYREYSRGWSWRVSASSPAAQPSKLQSVRVSIEPDIRRKLHYWKSSTVFTLRQTTSRSPCWYRSRSVRRIWHRWPLTDWTAADWVRSHWQAARLALFLPLWPNTVCQDGPTPVGRHHSARRWRSTEVGTRPINCYSPRTAVQWQT